MSAEGEEEFAPPGNPEIMELAFLTATVALVIPTLLPMLRLQAWWVRSFDFPRLQLSFLLLLLLVLESLALDWREPQTAVLAALGASCLGYQAWWILPYTRLYPVDVKSAGDRDHPARVRIMTANVLASNRNARDLLEIVRRFRPDILVTLESNAWWQDQLDELKGEYPHAIKCPRENLYGMHVYSRLVLKNSRVEYLVAAHIPSIHTLVLLPSGDEVRVHFLHPEPPAPQYKTDSSERDVELLLVAKSVAKTDTPTIVTGDLNDVGWSKTTRLFRKISGLLDPRVGRGMFNTFHAGHWFLRWPLDHLFHSSHFILAEIRRLPAFGSDHFPLLAELSLEHHRRGRQERLPLDRRDLQMVQRKAQEESVTDRKVPEQDITQLKK